MTTAKTFHRPQNEETLMTTPRPEQTTNHRIVLDVDRDGWTNGLQLNIAQLDENNSGMGYRLHGPKYNGSSERLIRHQVDERDASEIREMLDAVFPMKNALVAVPSEWDCSHGTADDEPFCQELDEDEHPECPTIRVHREDADRFAAMVDMLHELRNHVAELENGPATFYRARRVVGERGDTLGHYRTREQAQARCIAELRAKSTLVPDVIFSWVGVDGTEVLGVSTPAEPCPDVTDYVVTEVTVSGTAADEGSVR